MPRIPGAGRDTDEELRLRRDEVQNLRDLNSRLAVIGKMGQFEVQRQNEQAKLDKAIRTAIIAVRGADVGARIGGVFGQTGAAVGGAVGGKVATGLDAVGQAAMSVKGGFDSITGAVSSFVQKSNPAAMERFQIILDDVSGIIGQTLEPVIETLGGAARLFGDVLASILPSGQEMKEFLKPVNDFLQDLREALEPLAPFIRDVLSVALKALGVALNIVLIPFRFLANLLRDLFGGGASPLRSSVGAAARNVSFTSAESFARNVNVAAFRSGTGTSRGIYHGSLDRISEFLDSINRTVKDIRLILPGGEEAAIKEANKFKDLNIARVSHAHVAERIERGDLTGFANEENALNYLKRMAEDMRKGAAKAGVPQEDIEEEIQRHIEQAKRRAMDGHPGGR